MVMCHEDILYLDREIDVGHANGARPTAGNEHRMIGQVIPVVARHCVNLYGMNKEV